MHVLSQQSSLSLCSSTSPTSISSSPSTSVISRNNSCEDDGCSSPELDVVSCTPCPQSSDSSMDDLNQKRYFCQRCLNHGLEFPRKGHKPFCRYAQCTCEDCMMVEHRRRLNNQLSQRKSDLEGAKRIPPGKKIRDPKCARCSAHGEKQALRGHKKNLCPFLKCTCHLCRLVENRRKLMAKQIKLRRDQQKARRAQLQGQEPLSIYRKSSENRESPSPLSGGNFLSPPKPSKKRATAPKKGQSGFNTDPIGVNLMPKFPISSNFGYSSSGHFDLTILAARLSTPTRFKFPIVHPFVPQQQQQQFGFEQKSCSPPTLAPTMEQTTMQQQQLFSNLRHPISFSALNLLNLSNAAAAAASMNNNTCSYEKIPSPAAGAELPSPTPVRPNFEGIKSLMQPFNLSSLLMNPSAASGVPFSSLAAGSFPFNVSNLLFNQVNNSSSTENATALTLEKTM